MNIEERNQTIIRTSIIGILANVLLAVFKVIVGLSVHSIAVVLDAVNNLSDAVSSIVTIVGTKLGSKLPDKKHPLGYGRIEYLSALIVSGIVLYAGITSAVESIKKIINPEIPTYTILSLIIIAVAVIVKFILGRYVKSQGEKANSQALVASGSDARFDAILSLSVLASALIYIFTGISLEAIVGVVIAVVIIKAGIEMIVDTLDEILGARPDKEVSKKIKQLFIEEPEVRGAYDLIINNYGPNKNYASVHLELPDTMTVDQVDVLTRKMEEKVYLETGVILTGVGVYSYNTKDEGVAKIQNHIQDIVCHHNWALQMHGFYIDKEKKRIRFDVVLNFGVSPKEALQQLYKEVGEAYPDYQFQIVCDIDTTD